MNISSLLLEAANLMAVGMVFVFVFLGLLLLMIKGIEKLVPEPEPVPTAPSVQPQTAGLTPARIAAITAAVQQYRQKNHNS